MSKIISFDLAFTDDKEIYFPGDTVSGTLILSLKESMEMREIKIECKGKADVRWTESRTTSNGKTTTTHTDIYKASETYFKLSETLAGKEGERSTLSSGDKIFNFTFQIPFSLPSSFEGISGNIRYFVKATIDRPWKFDHTTKKMFTVLDILDLNKEVNSRNPSGVSDSKTLCCWCCKSGAIDATVHTDRYGYVPGEIIVINATLENHSNSAVRATRAFIKQRTSFITPRKTKTSDKEIAKLDNEPGCGRNSQVNWTNKKLQIPAIPPSELRNCRIIDVDYFLVFEAELRTCSINLRAEVPILIGTVPLQGIAPTFMEQPEVAPSAPPLSSADIPSSYAPPPPSYTIEIGSEAVNIHEEEDSEHTMGESSYNPQYTFYDWSQSALSYK